MSNIKGFYWKDPVAQRNNRKYTEGQKLRSSGVQVDGTDGLACALFLQWVISSGSLNPRLRAPEKECAWLGVGHMPVPQQMGCPDGHSHQDYTRAGRIHFRKKEAHILNQKQVEWILGGPK